MIAINKYYDVDRERSVIRFVLTTEDQEYYINQLSESKFYDRIHSQLVKIIKYMETEGKVISFHSVIDYIKLNEKEINQKRILDGFKLVYKEKRKCQFSEDVQFLDELSKNRLFDTQIVNKTKKMLEDNASSVEIIQHIQNSLSKVIVDKSESIELTAERAKEDIYRAQQEGQIQLLTGLKEFDQAVGIAKKRHFVVAALSSVGKSFWSYDILLRICDHNDHDKIAILYFSLEISRQDFIMWLICNIANVVFRRLEGGGKKLTEEEIRRVDDAIAKIQKLPLKIISGPNTIDDVQMKSQKYILENKGKHTVIILDHHLKVQKNPKDTIRDHAIRLSSDMVALAKNNEAVTTILLAQLRRELMDKKYAESDHRPNSSFIQESGSLYQDADHVICLWRPEMHRNPINLPSSHDMHMIIEKNKNGQKDFDIIVECVPKYGQLFDKEDGTPFEKSKPQSWESSFDKSEDDEDEDELVF